MLDDPKDKDNFLLQANENGIEARPIWKLMHDLPMFERMENGGLENSRWLYDRIVNVPSSVCFP